MDANTPSSATGSSPLEPAYTALQQRIAALEQENAQLRADVPLIAQDARRVRVFNTVPYVVVITSVDGNIVRDVNAVGERMMHRPRADWINHSIDTVFAPESAAAIRALQRRCVAERHPVEVEEHLTLDGRDIWMYAIYTPMINSDGQIEEIVITTFNITERKHHELEQLRQHEAQIAAQSAALLELSTPLLTIAPGVVVMPLIGAIDAQRAAHLLETLPQGIADTHAHYAILDVTAVPLIDTQVAETLLHAAQAAHLLGTQIIITGIRPDVAQTLVAIGADLGQIVTQPDMQRGIVWALR